LSVRSNYRAASGVEESFSLGTPVDAHVHFHRLERVVPTLDSAVENFTRVCPSGRSITGVLLLAQGAHELIFEKLSELEVIGDWRLSRVGSEPMSLTADLDGRRLIIICGRQIRCQKGLEVLAIGTVTRFPEGLALDETMELVNADGGLAVLSWGFGKWLGARGALIERMIAEGVSGSFRLGDNGGRLQVLGLPRLLRVAHEREFQVLPGTDPFPFGKDYRRVGSYGFIAEGELELSAPFAALRRWLDSRKSSPTAYGTALGMLRFFVNQSSIQLQRRLAREAWK
jgi:hypothetical protein